MSHQLSIKLYMDTVDKFRNHDVNRDFGNMREKITCKIPQVKWFFMRLNLPHRSIIETCAEFSHYHVPTKKWNFQNGKKFGKSIGGLCFIMNPLQWVQSSVEIYWQRENIICILITVHSLFNFLCFSKTVVAWNVVCHSSCCLMYMYIYTCIYTTQFVTSTCTDKDVQSIYWPCVKHM